MRFPKVLFILFIAAAAAAACSSSDDSDGQSNAPDYKTVFDTLPPPTPNKLRGVWLSKTTAENGTTTDLHLKFTDGFLVGGTRCLPKDKSRSLTIGGSAKLETTALDAATGRFTVANLSFSTRDGDLTCGTTLAGNTYEFSISERKLTLSITNSGSSSSFEKIGD